MKIKISIGILILLITTSFSLNQSRKILSGHWKLICIEDLITNTKAYRPESKYMNNELIFEFKDNGIDGIIKGKTTSNKVSGVYEIYDNQKINVSKFGGTKIAERGWGSDFWSMIKSSSSYNYNSDTLIIYFDSDTKAMKFVE